MLYFPLFLLFNPLQRFDRYESIHSCDKFGVASSYMSVKYKVKGNKIGPENECNENIGGQSGYFPLPFC